MKHLLREIAEFLVEFGSLAKKHRWNTNMTLPDCLVNLPLAQKFPAEKHCWNTNQMSQVEMSSDLGCTAMTDSSQQNVKNRRNESVNEPLDGPPFFEPLDLAFELDDNSYGTYPIPLIEEWTYPDFCI